MQLRFDKQFSMSAIARPFVYCHGGVGEPIRLVAAATAAAGGEDGDTSERGSGRGKSAQLQRWARARRIRSGRTVDYSRKAESSAPVAVREPEASPQSQSVALVNYDSSDEDDDNSKNESAREVYMISDGTGWTADHAVQAALGQFENCFVDQRCAVDTHLFSQVQLGFCSPGFESIPSLRCILCNQCSSYPNPFQIQSRP